MSDQVRDSGRRGGPGAAGRARRAPGDIPAGPAPDASSLREAALSHLAKFSSTEANLVRVLRRRVGRWAARAGREGRPAEAVADAVAAAEAAAAAVARALAAAGAVDDAAFAAARARRLGRAGRSRRAVAAHLASKGVPAPAAAEAIDAEAVDEVVAALAHLRRRRQGPFDRPDAPAEEGARQRALGALARAGFPRDVAETALDMAPDAAAERLDDARRA